MHKQVYLYSLAYNKAPTLAGGLPVFPGNYVVQFEPASTPAQSVAVVVQQWGDLPRVDLTPDHFQKRATLELSVAPATLPDAKISTSCHGSSVWMRAVLAGQPESQFKAVYDVPVNSPATSHQIRFFPYLKTTKLQYVLNLGSMRVPIDLAPGQAFQGAIERIDVKKIKIVREDGSHYITDVSFKVEYKNGSGRWSSYGLETSDCTGAGVTKTTFDAPSGIYVPKGEYRVTLSYLTEEGPKEQTHILNL